MPELQLNVIPATSRIITLFRFQVILQQVFQLIARAAIQPLIGNLRRLSTAPPDSNFPVPILPLCNVHLVMLEIPHQPNLNASLVIMHNLTPRLDMFHPIFRPIVNFATATPVGLGQLSITQKQLSL
jgi:hypothetical protein